MRFKNLSFIDHPTTNGIMAQVFTDSGKRISVVAGAFEVFIDGEDDVRTYQTREDIDEILSEHFYTTEETMTPKELAYNLHEDMEMISADVSRQSYPDIVGFSGLKEDEQIEVLETLFKQKTITWKFNFI